MRVLNLKYEFKRFVSFVALSLVFFLFANQVSYAACSDNVVPNPLDPDCSAQAGTLTFGFLINRLVNFLPYIVTLIAVGSYVWGALKLMFAQNEDGRNNAIKIFSYTTAGLIAFFSIWLILFIVSLITGVDLLKAIGQ